MRLRVCPQNCAFTPIPIWSNGYKNLLQYAHTHSRTVHTTHNTQQQQQNIWRGEKVNIQLEPIKRNINLPVFDVVCRHTDFTLNSRPNCKFVFEFWFRNSGALNEYVGIQLIICWFVVAANCDRSHYWCGPRQTQHTTDNNNIDSSSNSEN